ncbi:MAG TPA: preQ(1) synthase [Phycisphaerales bacterium]|nr:preQ(1) synthase [Phycisphaerales bacterium]
MPRPELLETFETPAREPIVIEHVAEEFTSQCPKTGHPDFGTVRLRYQPAARGSAAGATGCVELKSLKLYYQSFRMEGIFYEAVTDRIRNDLARLLRPAWMQVITEWRGRGGIRSVVRAEAGEVPTEWKGR